jgi:hypothetical protein
MWDLWRTKWRWGSFSPSTSVSQPIFIPSIAPQSPSSIIWGWYNRPAVAAVPSGLKSHPTKNNKILNIFNIKSFLSFGDGLKRQINPDHDLSDISRV